VCYGLGTEIGLAGAC